MMNFAQASADVQANASLKKLTVVDEGGSYQLDAILFVISNVTIWSSMLVLLPAGRY